MRYNHERIVRGALTVLAVLFLPLAIWFAWSGWRKYWLSVLALVAVSAFFLWLANDHRPEGWLSSIDDSGGPANPDARD